MPQAFTLLGFLRFRKFLYPAAYAWLALHLALPLANIAWRRRCVAARPADGGSWGRGHEAVAAAVRATAMAGGIPFVLTLASMDAGASTGSPRVDWRGGALTAALNVVNISAAPTIALMWYKPLRLG